MSIGGVWTLMLTGLNFNISAAVGFISILGVAVMNGLLMVSVVQQAALIKQVPRSRSDPASERKRSSDRSR